MANKRDICLFRHMPQNHYKLSWVYMHMWCPKSINQLPRNRIPGWYITIREQNILDDLIDQIILYFIIRINRVLQLYTTVIIFRLNKLCIDSNIIIFLNERRYVTWNFKAMNRLHIHKAIIIIWRYICEVHSVYTKN